MLLTNTTAQNLYARKQPLYAGLYAARKRAHKLQITFSYSGLAVKNLTEPMQFTSIWHSSYAFTGKGVAAGPGGAKPLGEILAYLEPLSIRGLCAAQCWRAGGVCFLDCWIPLFLQASGTPGDWIPLFLQSFGRVEHWITASASRKYHCFYKHLACSTAHFWSSRKTHIVELIFIWVLPGCFWGFYTRCRPNAQWPHGGQQLPLATIYIYMCVYI